MEIPVRQTKKDCQAVASILREALEALSQQTLFKLEYHTRAEGLACRIRDAVKGLRNYRWDVGINLDLLDNTAFKVAVRGNVVYIGTPEQIKALTKRQTNPATSIPSTLQKLRLNNPTDEQLLAACTLHDCQAIKSASIIEYNDPLEAAAALERIQFDIEGLDIELVKQTPTTLVLF